jgi:hypothetical protein
VYEQLQQIQPSVRVLLSSGQSATADRERLPTMPVPFVPKPYRPDELVRTIRQILDQGSGVRGQGSGVSA